MTRRHHHRKLLTPLDLLLGPALAIKPPSKGKPNRRIIAIKVVNGREYLLHATKGWRSRVA